MSIRIRAALVAILSVLTFAGVGVTAAHASPAVHHHKRCACNMLTGNQQCHCPIRHGAKRTIAPGPYQLKEKFGSFFVGSVNLNAGTPVIATADHIRNITVVDQGSQTFGFENYTQETSNGLFVAANDNCNGITLKSNSTSNGTVWEIVTITGRTGDFAINRYCTQANGGGSTTQNSWYLTGFDSVGVQWTVCVYQGCTAGTLQAIAYEPV